MSDDRDLYAVLGVPPDADRETIRAARRALLLKYHPDRFSGDPKEAGRRTAEINEAFDVLGDPARRARYDEDYGVLEAEYEEAPLWDEPPPPPEEEDWRRPSPVEEPPEEGPIETWGPRKKPSKDWISPALGVGVVLLGIAFASGMLRMPTQQTNGGATDLGRAPATSGDNEAVGAPRNTAGDPAAGNLAVATGASPPAGDARDPAAGDPDPAFAARVRASVHFILTADDDGDCFLATDQLRQLTADDNGQSVRFIQTDLGKELVDAEQRARTRTEEVCGSSRPSGKSAAQSTDGDSEQNGSAQIIVTATRSNDRLTTTDQQADASSAPAPTTKVFTVHRAGPQP